MGGGPSQISLGVKGTPTPGCFCQRVRKRLKRKELSFWFVQKNAKKRKRVPKNVKRKNLSIVASDEWPFPAGSESSVGSAQGKGVAPGVGLEWTVSGMGRTSPLPLDFLELRILKGLRERAA